MVKALLNHAAFHGLKHLPLRLKIQALLLSVLYRMSFDDAYRLYGKYCGSWGDASRRYRFEAIKDGKVVGTVVRDPMATPRLAAAPDRTVITEGDTFEVVSIRARVTDQNGNVLPFYNATAQVRVDGPMIPYGSAACLIQGGMGGVYLRTTGKTGNVNVTLSLPDTEPVTLTLRVQ